MKLAQALGGSSAIGRCEIALLCYRIWEPSGGFRTGEERPINLDEATRMNDQLTLCATCGLLCRACSVYLASTEDPEWLARLAVRNGVSVEEEHCLGCRSTDRSYHCESCHFSECAREKGYLFCSACSESPCPELKAWRNRMPHRIEVFEALRRIAEAGWSTWYQEAVEDFSCNRCGTLNSAYVLACRNCGAEPSCGFVERHWDAITQYSSREKEQASR